MITTGISMTREQHLLTILGEECSEAAVRVSKVLRFGLADIEPGQPFTARERLVKELQDILAMMDMLDRENIITVPRNTDAITAKQEKVENYLEYSEMIGMLKPNHQTA